MNKFTTSAHAVPHTVHVLYQDGTETLHSTYGGSRSESRLKATLTVKALYVRSRHTWVVRDEKGRTVLSRTDFATL